MELSGEGIAFLSSLQRPKSPGDLKLQLELLLLLSAVMFQEQKFDACQKLLAKITFHAKQGGFRDVVSAACYDRVVVHMSTGQVDQAIYLLNKYLDDQSIFEQCQVVKCYAMLCTAIAASQQFDTFKYQDVTKYLQKPISSSGEQLQLVLAILGLNQCARIRGIQLVDYYDI